MSADHVDQLRRRLLLAMACAPFAPLACKAPGPSHPPRGDLTITTDPPGAEIRVNDGRLGPSPVTITLPPGPARIEASERNGPGRGGRSGSRVVEVRAGERSTVAVELDHYWIPGRPFTIAAAAVFAPVACASSPDAQRWLHAAAAEHASVASFARATLELMALGAPLALVQAHQQAALDELRHAELCLALATARGAAADPAPFGPMPVAGPREASFARFCADLVREGCVNETLASLEARTDASSAEAGDVRAALTRVADDEAEHAALAWQTLRWAVEAGGPDAATAARTTLDAELARVRASGADGERAVRSVLAPLVRATFGRATAC